MNERDSTYPLADIVIGIILISNSAKTLSFERGKFSVISTDNERLVPRVGKTKEQICWTVLNFMINTSKSMYF